MKNQNAYKREIGKGNDAIISHPELVSGSLHYNNEMLNQVQHDVRKGFTLIELLVVVLIIGILASVALPQYQKAVIKSRFTQIELDADNILKAQEIYFLENNVYANDLSDLDIEVLTDQYHYCQLTAPINSQGEPVAENRKGVTCSLTWKGQAQQGAFVVLQEWYADRKETCCSYANSNYEGDFLCEQRIGNDNWTPGCNGSCRCLTRYR